MQWQNPHTGGQGRNTQDSETHIGTSSKYARPPGNTLVFRAGPLGHVPGKKPLSIGEKEINLKTQGQEQKLLQKRVFTIQEGIYSSYKGWRVWEA